MKKILAFVLVIFSTAYAISQGCHSDILLKNTTIGGIPAIAATGGLVNVCLETDKTIPCTTMSVVLLYSDSALTKPISNPVSTDNKGNYSWCAASGTYNQQPTGSGVITKTSGPVTIPINQASSQALSDAAPHNFTNTITTRGAFTALGTVTVPTPVNPTDAVTKTYADAIPLGGVPALSGDYIWTGRNQYNKMLQRGTGTASLTTAGFLAAMIGDTSTATQAFRDESGLTTSGTPYISLDCAPGITSSATVSAVFCLQARPTYGGTGTVGTLAGLNFVPTVNGPVTKLAGVFVADALGSTNATTYNGVEVSTLSHCTTCRAFFAASNPSFFGGMTTHQAGITLAGTTSPFVLNATAGNAGQVMLSNGSGATPSWIDTQSFPNRLGVGSNTPITDNNTFLSHRAVTGTAQFAHSFRAEDTINTATGDAFASYDSIVNMTGTVDYGHLISFQGRDVYSGLGLLATMASVNSAPVTNGPVTDVKHYALDESTGASVPFNEYGLYVAQLTRASGNKFAIFTQGITHSQFNGVVEVPGGVNFNGSGTLQISGSGGVAGQYLRSTGTSVTWATAVRGTYAAYLNTGVTNGTQTLQTIKPLQPVTVQRISINLGVAPTGCPSPTVVTISDGTNSASCSVANAAAAAECDVNVNFGNTLDFTIKTTQTTCTTAPSGMNVTAQYIMQ